MEITFYKLENDAIVSVGQDIKPVDWNKEIDWIDCRVDDRKVLTEYLQKKGFLTNILKYIEHPEANPFTNTSGEAIILNQVISNADNIYSTDYISVIVDKNLIFTITPIKSDIFTTRNIATYSENKYHTIRNFLLNLLAIKTLAQGNTNMSIARTRLQGMENLLVSEPEELSSNDVMSCERDISQLSDIIEDQYVGFELLASLISANNQQTNQQTHDTIKGFTPLDKAMLRLEKKAESLRLQYTLIQQEKSTRKINLLTIIQAIFVPLTFIAGVYGMNFINMPELEWKYGYLIAWVVFIALAGGLLSYFYRKGWFD